MGFSSKCFTAFLLQLSFTCLVAGHGVRTNKISNAKGNNLAASPMSQRVGASLQNSASNPQKLESFNRPEGIESLFPNIKREQQFGTSYGRTFGQYGSYKKHKSWNRAVARDMHRHGVAPKDFKTKFPWLVKKLHLPSVHGFGLNGFWNSYALPEDTPNLEGLGQSKFGQ